MKVAWEYRDGRSLVKAVAFGTVALGSFFIVLGFSPFLATSSDTQRAKSSVSAEVSSPGLFSEAMAAEPITVPVAIPAPDIAGGDTPSDDYRLERDSCCIGN